MPAPMRVETIRRERMRADFLFGGFGCLETSFLDQGNVTNNILIFQAPVPEHARRSLEA
jgi:hypothetical protein